MDTNTRTRGFELVSKYSDETENKVPRRGTKLSACYDVFNNTGADIVLLPGEMSKAITTKFKAYMQDDEVLMAYVRSGHGFKFSVRLANSTGIIDCVPAGTLISTPDGNIPVEKLCTLDHPIVYSYNEETNTIEIDNITDTWIVHDLELLQIETSNGSIKVPLTKEIYTRRGWITANELTIDDEILSID